MESHAENARAAVAKFRAAVDEIVGLMGEKGDEAEERATKVALGAVASAVTAGVEANLAIEARLDALIGTLETSTVSVHLTGA